MAAYYVFSIIIYSTKSNWYDSVDTLYSVFGFAVAAIFRYWEKGIEDAGHKVGSSTIPMELN